MDIELPSEWTSIFDPRFVASQKMAQNFHDSGFFRFHKSEQILGFVLNPVWFGYEYSYACQDLNACEFRLHLDGEVDDGQLERAAAAFEVMKIILTEASLRVCFPSLSLEMKIKPSSSVFRFVKLKDGEDYWSLG